MTIQEREQHFEHPAHPKRGLRLEDSTIVNVTKGLIDNHPEVYPSLRTVIKRAGVHIGSRKARVELTQAGFFVKDTIDSNGFHRYNLSVESERAAASHLQHLFFEEPSRERRPSLKKLTRGVAQYQKFPTVTGALREAGIDRVGPRRIKDIVQLLRQSGFEVAEIRENRRGAGKEYSVRQYYVSPEDLFRIVDYMRKNRTRVQAALKPSTSPHRTA